MATVRNDKNNSDKSAKSKKSCNNSKKAKRGTSNADENGKKSNKTGNVADDCNNHKKKKTSTTNNQKTNKKHSGKNEAKEATCLKAKPEVKQESTRNCGEENDNTSLEFPPRFTAKKKFAMILITIAIFLNLFNFVFISIDSTGIVSALEWKITSVLAFIYHLFGLFMVHYEFYYGTMLYLGIVWIGVLVGLIFCGHNHLFGWTTILVEAATGVAGTAYLVDLRTVRRIEVEQPADRTAAKTEVFHIFL